MLTRIGCRLVELAHDALWLLRERVVFRLTPLRRDFGEGESWRRGEWHEQPVMRRMMNTLDEPLMRAQNACVDWLVEHEDLGSD